MTVKVSAATLSSSRKKSILFFRLVMMEASDQVDGKWQWLSSQLLGPRQDKNRIQLRFQSINLSVRRQYTFQGISD
ncbi:hypothetical protein CMK14_22510 [Candidatus Poribacteria bacterium]|nr:hypothetical protein [Candidatus Poribacteria bacterium]